MIDKSFQLAILKAVAPTYPGRALPVWDDLVAMTPGNDEREKLVCLVRHLAALQEEGYLADVGCPSPGRGFQYNQAFRITTAGLAESGEDILRPDPYKPLREALLAQAAAVRALTEEEKKTFGSVLAELPLAALERLRDGALDKLLAILFG